MKRIYSYGFVLTFIWIGFLLAISFMEAPLKFQAPSVTTAIGVEIGKIVFKALNALEIIFSMYFVLQIGYVYKLDKKLFVLIFFLFIIVMIQSIYLLPTLDRYADIVINGGSSPSKIAHIVYVIFEVVKLFLLFFVGFRQLSWFKKEIIAVYEKVVK
ncbi:hypothetical protein [Aquimarina sp. 2201CG14-23]|uniref:hypothetical protein n=1 Tax=Aquimarina mycalae TaxID=3040073 RepID=UPI002477F4E2|nr:hypothetical protein [Aquimarina sp. 2201CG14-23]MDH7446706.1 hypothetical protein [Aquimarina sp. 2201CG14-23]